MADYHKTDMHIEMWKTKKQIKGLESERGNGTTMISLIIPPRDQIARITKMLDNEYGTASNIKSRVNRQSVLCTIKSAQQRLKLYNKVPPNGLVLYVGTIVSEDRKEKKITISFEPFKPINVSMYLCDNKFHVEALNELLESHEKFGFIVIDGHGTLFGTFSGNTRKPNVAGLILAGSADFKTVLSGSDKFDPRLQARILTVEKRLMEKYFEEIRLDTGKYVFGLDDTLKALERGAVKILIVSESLEINRYVMKNSSTGEWFTDEYKGFGCTLEIVTNKSQEGSHFCRGFGGIGGILRYQLDVRSFDEFSDDEEDYDDGDVSDDAK
ncbi:hypothetical protein ACLB2K_013856 [Fragaria x ananassa]